MIDLGTAEMYYVRERVSQVFNRTYRDHALDSDVLVTGCLHVLEYTKHTARGSHFRTLRFAFVQRNQDGRYRSVQVAFDRDSMWDSAETKTIVKNPWQTAVPDES